MNLYFNNWFSSITPIIKDIKKRHGSWVHVIGSSHNENHAMSDAVDEFFVEDPSIPYVQWLMSFLKEHKVDIFFVKKWAEEIFEIREQLEAMGIVVILEDEAAWNSVESKHETYEKIKKETAIALPDYVRSANANTVLSFLFSHDTCMKLDKGEGGASYKHITDGIKDINELSEGIYNRISTEKAAKLITEASTCDLEKFLFMEYLKSPELSVDCYNSRKGFLSVCRSKQESSRVQKMFYDKKINDICEEICRVFRFRFPFNVQFRLKNNGNSNDIDDYRLLEINPRISGGSYYQLLAGLNICDACLCDIMGGTAGMGYEPESYKNLSTKLITHVEQPILLGI